jgi:hypothetical protein
VRRRNANWTYASALCLFALAWPGSAHARRTRPLFEPTDLELEDTGVLELDTQFGMIRSRGPARVVVPDFEIDLGLLPNLEIDLDGAYAIEGPPRGKFRLDHAAPDSLWLAAKLGIFDARDESARTAFALGVQCGPKFPTAAGSHGLGTELLVLIGTSYARTHVVWNIGGFVDPDPDAQPGRPVGIEFGADVDIDLDSADVFSLELGASAVRFLSSDPHQLLSTAGVTWSPIPTLDLSLTALVGFLSGSDRYGLLLGVSPKFALFH